MSYISMYMLNSFLITVGYPLEFRIGYDKCFESIVPDLTDLFVYIFPLFLLCSQTLSLACSVATIAVALFFSLYSPGGNILLFSLMLFLLSSTPLFKLDFYVEA